MGVSFKLWAATRLWSLGEQLVRNARPNERDQAIIELRKATKRLENGVGRDDV